MHTKLRLTIHFSIFQFFIHHFADLFPSPLVPASSGHTSFLNMCAKSSSRDTKSAPSKCCWKHKCCFRMRNKIESSSGIPSPSNSSFNTWYFWAICRRSPMSIDSWNSQHPRWVTSCSINSPIRF